MSDAKSRYGAADVRYVTAFQSEASPARLLAAANPGWEVIGLDLQPVHVVEAQEAAAAAGLGVAGGVRLPTAAGQIGGDPGGDQPGEP